MWQQRDTPPGREASAAASPVTAAASVKKRDLSIPVARANWYMLLAAGPVTGLLVAVYCWRWRAGPLTASLDGMVSRPLYGIAAYAMGAVVAVIGIVAHELLHGITFALLAQRPLSAVEFGFQRTTFTPYARAREAMPARVYRAMILAPGLVLGLLPALAGIVTGSPAVLLFGAMFTLAAGGDFLILWLIRGVDGNTLVKDHPRNVGCFVLEREQRPAAPAGR